LIGRSVRNQKPARFSRYPVATKLGIFARECVQIREGIRRLGAGRKRSLLPHRFQYGEGPEIGLKAAVRFRDSISLQRTVQAKMHPDRSG